MENGDGEEALEIADDDDSQWVQPDFSWKGKTQFYPDGTPWKRNGPQNLFDHVKKGGYYDGWEFPTDDQEAGFASIMVFTCWRRAELTAMLDDEGYGTSDEWRSGTAVPTVPNFTNIYPIAFNLTRNPQKLKIL